MRNTFHYPDHLKRSDPDRNPSDQRCHWEGCVERGEYRAPKDRTLKDYYIFCLEHVRIYNAQWNFHEGLGEDEIEQEFKNAATWERPTWKIGQQPLSRQSWQNIFDPLELLQDVNDVKSAAECSRSAQTDGELNARQVFGLQGHITGGSLKARYKELVKIHHPDANGGAEEAEDKMKSINAAYQTLRASLID